MKFGPFHQGVEGVHPKGLIHHSKVLLLDNVSKRRVSVPINIGPITFGSVPDQEDVDPSTLHLTWKLLAEGAVQLSKAPLFVRLFTEIPVGSH